MWKQSIRVLAALAVALTTQAVQADLPAKVANKLERAGIPQTAVSVWAQRIGAPTPDITLNADRAMNPASVMKLVTAFAALDRLGVGHTWDTRVAHSGRIDTNGRLHGDLYIIGDGDPLLNDERLWKLLRRVRGAGIAKVEGDIVLDSSRLRLPPHDPFAFDDRGLRPYNSGPHGLLLHFNTLQLYLTPGAPGEPVGVTASPPVRGLALDNRITTSEGGCGVWFRGLDAELDTSGANARLILEGRLPASCGERPWGASPLVPEQFGTAVVAGMWQEVGGHLTGVVRSGSAPDTATKLLTHTSPGLGEAVREMNKWSSNVIARQLIAALGRDRPQSTDMMAAGSREAEQVLAEAGIDVTDLVVENGAGLSRIARIRAETLAQLLLAVWKKPYMPEFMAALSVMGVDGTAHRRLRDSPARGQAHVKTGTIDGVRAIAGYVLDRHGTRHAVVMLVNHPRAAAAAAAQDALIEWVWAATD